MNTEIKVGDKVEILSVAQYAADLADNPAVHVGAVGEVKDVQPDGSAALVHIEGDAGLPFFETVASLFGFPTTGRPFDIEELRKVEG